MSEGRGATTVAEGIETAIQLEIVRDLGIQVGQGFRLGMPAERPIAESIDIEALLPSAPSVYPETGRSPFAAA